MRDNSGAAAKSPDGDQPFRDASDNLRNGFTTVRHRRRIGEPSLDFFRLLFFDLAKGAAGPTAKIDVP